MNQNKALVLSTASNRGFINPSMKWANIISHNKIVLDIHLTVEKGPNKDKILELASSVKFRRWTILTFVFHSVINEKSMYCGHPLKHHQPACGRGTCRRSAIFFFLSCKAMSHTLKSWTSTLSMSAIVKVMPHGRLAKLNWWYRADDRQGQNSRFNRENIPSRLLGRAELKYCSTQLGAPLLGLLS